MQISFFWHECEEERRNLYMLPLLSIVNCDHTSDASSQTRKNHNLKNIQNFKSEAYENFHAGF